MTGAIVGGTSGRAPEACARAIGIPPQAEHVGREEWVDFARGVGIVLVVLGHANRGLLSAATLPNRAYQGTLDDALYVFHMPFFFLLAGLFLGRGIERSAPADFLLRKARALLWPACLWTWVLAAVQVLAGGASNASMTWSSFPWSPVPPYSLYWFLWALFVAQLISLLLWPWISRHGSWLLVVLAGLSWVISQQVRSTDLGFEWLASAFYFWPFLAVGIRLGAGRLRELDPVKALPVFLLVEATSGITLSRPWLAPLAGVVGAVSFATLCAAAWRRLSGTRVGETLVALGRRSMPIYLVHCIFTAGVRAVLVRAGLDSIGAYLVLCTALGLLGSCCVQGVARYIRVERTLGFA